MVHDGSISEWLDMLHKNSVSFIQTLDGESDRSVIQQAMLNISWHLDKERIRKPVMINYTAHLIESFSILLWKCAIKFGLLCSFMPCSVHYAMKTFNHGVFPKFSSAFNDIIKER